MLSIRYGGLWTTGSTCSSRQPPLYGGNDTYIPHTILIRAVSTGGSVDITTRCHNPELESLLP